MIWPIDGGQEQPRVREQHQRLAPKAWATERAAVHIAPTQKAQLPCQDKGTATHGCIRVDAPREPLGGAADATADAAAVAQQASTYFYQGLSTKKQPTKKQPTKKQPYQEATYQATLPEAAYQEATYQEATYQRSNLPRSNLPRRDATICPCHRSKSSTRLIHSISKTTRM